MTSVINKSSSQPARILVVDDEAFVREAIELYFITEGFEVFSASGGKEALAILESEEVIDLAVLDILMPEMDGIELLRELKKSYPQVEVVMASGCGTLETAVEAMRLGAYDYVTKPILNFDEDLLKVVKKALERHRLLAANRKLAQDLGDINRELKSSNTQLRKRMAELEILYETGSLLGEISGPEAIIDLATQTLTHQLGIPLALILLREPGGWRLRASSPGDAPLLPLDIDCLSGDALRLDVIHVSPARDPRFTEFMGSLGVSGECAADVTLVPLRAAGEVIGLLLARADVSEDAGDDPLRAVKLLAGQIAAPLAFAQVAGSSGDVEPDPTRAAADDFMETGNPGSDSSETDHTPEQVPS